MTTHCSTGDGPYSTFATSSATNDRHRRHSARQPLVSVTARPASDRGDMRASRQLVNLRYWPAGSGCRPDSGPGAAPRHRKIWTPLRWTLTRRTRSVAFLSTAAYMRIPPCSRDQLAPRTGQGSGRSSCRPPVPRQDRGAGLPGRQEFQVGGRAARGEQPLAGAEDRREGQQPVLVDQVVTHERVHEAQAAGDDHVSPLALDRVDDVAVHGL